MSTQTISLDSVLQDVFKISTGFREHQREVAERILFNNKVLFIARTGHGKSLCYQIPAYIFEGVTLVFSPLRALMRDQNEKLNHLYKISSAIVSSDFEPLDNRAVLVSAVEGKYKILFIAPERMDNIDWQEMVVKMRISMIVIDEAHCISVWGHDFRPFYRRLVSLIQKLPKGTPVLGLTATANKRVEQDILQQMGLETYVYRGNMQRPNLHLQKIPVNNDPQKMAFILEYLQKVKGTGVIYTGTKDNAELLSRFLKSENISAEFYHGSLETEKRYEVQDRWMKNKIKVVCATNALGMGVDKPDIRFIIHFQFPQSPIHYYQEIGRAGRDGQPSDCILLYNPADKDLPLYFIESAKPKAEKYETIYKILSGKEGLRRIDIMRETGYTQKLVQQITADLEEQGLAFYDAKEKLYYSRPNKKGKIYLEEYDLVREGKLEELDAMMEYGDGKECLSGFLTRYLGDPSGYQCGVCGNCKPSSRYSQPDKSNVQKAIWFLKSDYPRLEEKRGSHTAGIALALHGKTDTGAWVSACKYKTHAPFPPHLVEESVNLLRKWYPMNDIDCIMAVPSTLSGSIVENFAKQVAGKLNIPYCDELIKKHQTRPQKEMTNYVQKKDNVKDVFTVKNQSAIERKRILLIDDIYDSGQTLKEIGWVLMKHNADIVYPFTITKTLHSDRD